MFREREFKKFNSCLCSTAPKLKSTIKQFIQIEHKQPQINEVHSNRLRHSRLLTNMPQQNHVTCIKYPLSNQLSTYQPFPVHQPENLYDEIDPVDENLTTTYDHLSRPYIPQIRNGYRSHVSIDVRDVKPQFIQTTAPPPPPPIQKVPKISRRQFFNKSFNNTNSTSPSKSRLNKSLNSTTNLSDGQSISERSYLFEKWAADTSSGYNSSQDLSNNSASSNSSIISYCSINEPVMTKLTISNDKNSNLVDSGFSTFNIDNEDHYDATENLSSYSNVSPSSSSSFSGSYRESVHDLQPITSFPRIKNSMVAQIKKVQQQTPVKPLCSNQSFDNRSIAKSYSVSDVLFSMKKMGISNSNKNSSNVNKPLQKTSQLQFSPIYNRSQKATVIPIQYQTSTPPQERYSNHFHQDLDDYLCDEEVESILSPKNSPVEVKSLNTKTSLSNLYKYNNRNVAIWEQLV